MKSRALNNTKYPTSLLVCITAVVVVPQRQGNTAAETQLADTGAPTHCSTQKQHIWRVMDIDEQPASAAMADAEQQQGLQTRLETRPEHPADPFMMEVDTFQSLLLPLLSCAVCRRPLEDPVTLQCGNTLCRTCLPGSVEIGNCDTLADDGGAVPRSSCPYFWTLGSNSAVQGDSSSSTEKWVPPTIRERFECPFQSCRRKQHSRDVSSNYIIQKLLDILPSSHAPPVYSEKPLPSPDIDVEELRSRIQSELDCQICYLLLHDPITTPCGHSFCRPCLLRTSDHTTHPVCPTCRSPVLLPTPENTPTNVLMDTLIRTVFPDAAAERATSETSQRHSSSAGIDTPVFVCTLALPSVTCFLHIFEPRYRLMLRRCMAGDRRFGMVLPRSRVGGLYTNELSSMHYIQPSEGELPTGSRATFMQYGTMLEIKELQMLPDGRSLVETIGRERFQIQAWSVRDGYIVAKTNPLPDLEPTIYCPPPTNVVAGGLTTSVLADTPPDHLSLNELIYLTRCFVQSLRSITWLSARLRGNELEEQLMRLDSRGDAVRFAWWVGSKMPMEEGEAYTLLLQPGVRELYCVLGSWIGEMERQTW